MPTDDQLRVIFKAFDTDNSGKIDASELLAALRKGGKKVSREDVDRLIAAVDENGDGEVDFDEFRAVFELAPDAVLALGLGAIVDVGGSTLKALEAAVDATKYVFGGGALHAMFSGDKAKLEAANSVEVDDERAAKGGSTPAKDGVQRAREDAEAARVAAVEAAAEAKRAAVVEAAQRASEELRRVAQVEPL